MHAKKKNNRGFTLVELLVATVIIATGLAAGAAAFSAATRAQGAALRMTTAARLAEAKLAELQADGTTSGSAEGTFDEIATDTTPSNSDLSDYSYRWEATTGEVDGLARLQVEVWYRNHQRQPYTLVCYVLDAETTE